MDGWTDARSLGRVRWGGGLFCVCAVAFFGVGAVVLAVQTLGRGLAGRGQSVVTGCGGRGRGQTRTNWRGREESIEVGPWAILNHERDTAEGAQNGGGGEGGDKDDNGKGVTGGNRTKSSSCHSSVV